MATNDADAEKYKKLRRAILGGVFIAIIVASWHLYEYFHRKGDSDLETEIEHEIHEFTERLFTDEVKHNQFLAKIHYQGRTEAYAHDDNATHPLLELHEDLLTGDTNSTTYFLRRLYDNYELDANVVEHVSKSEIQEEKDFLAAVMKTKIMKRTMKYLQNKKCASADPTLQFRLLYDIWFTRFSRDQGNSMKVGSSGFEFVFLAELRNRSILGLHNWIYFHEQEKASDLDYKGYIDRIDLGKDDQHLLDVRFTFHNLPKSTNELFIGTSPELELALYTVCFMVSMDKPCPVQLGKTKFTIITYSWDWHGKKVISGAHPAAFQK